MNNIGTNTNHPNYIKGWDSCAQLINDRGAAHADPKARLQHNAARVAPHWTRGYRAAYKNYITDGLVCSCCGFAGAECP